MAMRLYDRFPQDYKDRFGMETPTEEQLERLDEEISDLLPDQLYWIGNDLYIDTEDEQPEDFSLECIIDKAYEKVLREETKTE